MACWASHPRPADVVTRIAYRSLRQWKYQLLAGESIQTTLTAKATRDSEHGWVTIFATGRLYVRKGYAWNGPSGPTRDTENFMRGSLFHDALYQLLREGTLPPSARAVADQLLRDVIRADGMSRFRAWYVYRAVRMFGRATATRSR